MTTSTRMVGISLLAALAMAVVTVPVLAGAIARGAPGGPLVVEQPRDGWPDADVEAFSEVCRATFTPAACGCVLAQLEEYYDDFEELSEDESEAAIWAAFRQCRGLLAK